MHHKTSIAIATVMAIATVGASPPASTMSLLESIPLQNRQITLQEKNADLEKQAGIACFPIPFAPWWWCFRY